jgi:asparaginyl-tRNA synthetase
MESQTELLRQKIRIDDAEKYVGTFIVVCGWIVTARWQKNLIFIKLSDSQKSKLFPLQIVFQKSDNPEYYESLCHLTAGCSLVVKGSVILSPAKGQKIEMQGKEFYILGNVEDPSTYPLAKADLSLESFRSTPHIACHYPTKACIYKIRSQLMTATEMFYGSEGYTKVDMPLITFSECEGGCQPMQATLLLSTNNIKDIPTIKEKPDIVDFTKDFFGIKASLTVSAQLELETQLPLGDVWTVTRAIRGEPSQTSKHLCEFSMIEIEKAFTADSTEIINIIERYIKYCIDYILVNCQDELKNLENKLKNNIITKLTKYLSSPFIQITHVQAVDMIISNSSLFSTLPSYFDDLNSEHEKYIVDHFGLPVIVKNYPKKIKAFYMPVIEETDEESKGVEHVDCFDILVPDVGELVGGSQRIHKLAELEHRIDELGLDKKPLEDYIALRKNGTIPHGGAGIGFERLVKFITGVENVKDCVAYPRFIGSGK